MLVAQAQIASRYCLVGLALSPTLLSLTLHTPSIATGKELAPQGVLATSVAPPCSSLRIQVSAAASYFGYHCYIINIGIIMVNVRNVNILAAHQYYYVLLFLLQFLLLLFLLWILS